MNRARYVLTHRIKVQADPVEGATAEERWNVIDTTTRQLMESHTEETKGREALAFWNDQS